jgi:hypothetical protein
VSSWRLAAPHDAAFVYEFVAAIDPRWWRFSRHGLDPRRLLMTAQSVAAGAVILDDNSQPVGFSLLADVSGTSAVGHFEVFAVPGREHDVVPIVPEVVAAAFGGAPVRKLFHERFDDDPDLMTAMPGAWQLEVTLPEFAMIDGRFVDRHIYGLSRAEYERWSGR